MLAPLPPDPKGFGHILLCIGRCPPVYEDYMLPSLLPRPRVFRNPCAWPRGGRGIARLGPTVSAHGGRRRTSIVRGTRRTTWSRPSRRQRTSGPRRGKSGCADGPRSRHRRGRERERERWRASPCGLYRFSDLDHGLFLLHTGAVLQYAYEVLGRPRGKYVPYLFNCRALAVRRRPYSASLPHIR